LRQIVVERFPGVDPIAAILAGHVRVDGFPVRNPESLVAKHSSVVLRGPHPLAGEAKLRAALTAFAPATADRVALDMGAAAGGFTRVLLEAGVRRVYAVDAGYGQLLGSLRQDLRVINLEATNLGVLSRALVPDRIGLVAIDVSYLSLAEAVPQLETLAFVDDAELIALVKPMFELGLETPPGDDLLVEAVAHASRGIERAGWLVAGAFASPVSGHRGAKEWLLHARRR
jgi:23S rRNA (cytidine1920-2'-O)/16S rRNA (cytidine1409-2'-O)-methyltransferase